MTTINLLLVHKLQQYQVRVPIAATFAQLKVNIHRMFVPHSLQVTDVAWHKP